MPLTGDVNDCSPNQCLNGATCVDGTNSFSCTCVSGYSGLLCETGIRIPFLLHRFVKLRVLIR